jgi:hypothetical protein
MVCGSKPASRVRPLTRLALLALAASVGVLGGRSAFARWQPPGTGNSPAGTVRITGSDVVGLYPGAAKTLILSLRNVDRSHAALVRGIRVSDVATTNVRCLPAAGNLAIRQYAGPTLTIPAGGVRGVLVQLAMPGSVPDGCQRTTFTLRYSAETSVR